VFVCDCEAVAGSYASVGTAGFTDTDLPLGGISAPSITLIFKNFQLIIHFRYILDILGVLRIHRFIISSYFNNILLIIYKLMQMKHSSYYGIAKYILFHVQPEDDS
jgi:hypothetical protein